MNSRIALCAIALGATLFAADDAFAKGAGKARRHQTIAMTRPSDAPDPNAQGTVDITHGRNGDQAVIKMNRLDPRTVFEVRDAGTGAALGTAKTNRRGHATFNLSKQLAKSASAGGTDGVRKVDIVNQSTGAKVLKGDVAAPDPVPAEGYADYADDDGDSASVYLFTDPSIPDDTFSMTFYPAADQESDPYGTKFRYFEFNRDTAAGDKLPLDAGSVSDLAGRAFEIRAGDGTVALKGDLPAMTPFEEPVFEINDDDWSGVFDPSGFFPGSREPATKAKSKKHGGRKDDGADGFTLFIADGDGVLQDAGALDEESFDDFPDDGGGCGGYDPEDPVGFYVVIVIFGSDPSFDLDQFFGQFFGGACGWDCDGNAGSGGDGTSDPSDDGADDSNGGGEDSGAFGLRHKHHH